MTTPPLYPEVYQYFFDKLQDKQVAESMANRFFYFYTKNDWKIKVAKNKWQPMKSWKGTINTWIRNMEKYSPLESVQLKSNKLFNETNRQP